MKILIVEDDLEISKLLADFLQGNGYEVLCQYDGLHVLDCIQEHQIDLILLDIMLPYRSDDTILADIRKFSTVPVIVISAKETTQNKIDLLRLGADDYITKPFNPLEVVARVKTQLRRYVRYNNAANTKEIDAPIAEHDGRGLIINKNTHKCTLYGKEVTLTPIEFSILWYLCENRGKVISSEELFENIWGEKFLDNNNTVMAHIGRLREKLNEPAKKPKFIKTVWGVGYTIEK